MKEAAGLTALYLKGGNGLVNRAPHTAEWLTNVPGGNLLKRAVPQTPSQTFSRRFGFCRLRLVAGVGVDGVDSVVPLWDGGRP